MTKDRTVWAMVEMREAAGTDIRDMESRQDMFIGTQAYTVSTESETEMQSVVATAEKKFTVA